MKTKLHYLQINHLEQMIPDKQQLTSDLSHEAKSSFDILLILKLSDPDVKLICLIPSVVIVELETLTITLPSRTYPLGL